MKQHRHGYMLQPPQKTLTRRQANDSSKLAKRILVPLDFSDNSKRSLHYAVSLAKALRAALVLVYVAETNPAGAELGASHLPDLEADLRQTARRELARLKKHEIPDEVESQSVIRAGRSDTEILDVANSLKADLIVMATHSKCSQPGQLGTTAQRVASAATCPVLLVPVQQLRVPFFL